MIQDAKKSTCPANAAHTRALAVDRPPTEFPPQERLSSVQRTIHGSMARRSQAQPSGLSRERILEVALELAEEDGVEALSMRRLAQELDVWPMSVYRYFQDKDALLDAMAADLIDAVAAPDASASWRAQLHGLLEGARHAIAASPVVAER